MIKFYTMKIKLLLYIFLPFLIGCNLDQKQLNRINPKEYWGEESMARNQKKKNQ